MRNLLAGLTAGALLLAIAGCTQTAGAGTGGCKPADLRLAGHYYLNGIIEVGSELLLRPDGSFEFMLVYGALDQYGKGCWRVEGSSVLVVPQGRTSVPGTYTPDDRSFSGLRLSIDGRDLVWRLGRDTGRYERS